LISGSLTVASAALTWSRRVLTVSKGTAWPSAERYPASSSGGTDWMPLSSSSESSERSSERR
jgi:hypothetical protein